MRHAILFGCAPFALLTACVLAQDGTELERAEQDLTFRAAEYGLPELDELPDCWWAEPGKTCEHRCGATRPDGSPGVGAAGSFSSAVAPPIRDVAAQGGARRQVGDSTAPARLGAGSDLAGAKDASPGQPFAPDLPIRGPIPCPDPDGVVVCPHCKRMSSLSSIGLFKLHPQVDTRVVIANPSGAYRVVSMPALATAPGVEDPPAKYVNLKGGDVIEEHGDVDFDDDLYLLFGLGDEQEAVPASYWTACPADGSPCEIVLP